MENEEKPTLLPLHPEKLLDDDFSVYEAEVEKVLSDPLCRNIALSGPYGAGKSSVIEKIKERQQKRKENWITISLATFGGMDEKRAQEHDLVQNALEVEILRQMVHKIGTSSAPKSRFRKLSDRNRFFDVAIAALILTFAILTVYLANASSKLLSFQSSCAENLALTIWLTLAGVGIYHLVRSDAISKMVRRVKVFEAELEITPSDSASPYDHCADEIVYLLNASKVDAVVFEDLDRFDSVAIFERMRNLNALANDSRFSDPKKRNAKPLKFFFLVRDGLFENPHDRTKFFDYVIPVIPYIDPESALGIFHRALEGVGISIDKDGFLYQLSMYIDDPRIIHDIADEAYHYKRALFKDRSFVDGDSERLVALLAYKALFPRDFELLQVGRGYLHEVLHGKHRLIAKLNGDDEVKSETLYSMAIRQLVDELPDADALFNFTGSDIEREKDFEDLSMDAVLDNPSFPMLRFLVSSGYIDESYRRYISSFYPDTLCAGDDNFLSAVKQAGPIDLTYQPESPNKIVRRMSQGEFSRASMRNHWIISALLDSNDEGKINALMLSIKRHDGVEYLARFISSEQFNPKILARMTGYFDNPVAELLGNEEIPADDKRCVCKRLLVSEGGFCLIERENAAFAEYVDLDARILEEDSRFNDAEIGKGLSHAGYCAKVIDFPNASHTLLDFVYDNRLFSALPSIIDGYLDFKFGVSGSMGRGTLITEVLKLSGGPITDVIFGNMEYFVSNVVEESKVPLRDTSESVVSILNEETIQSETVEIYIKSLTDVEVEDITQVVSADYRNILLAYQLIKCDARNVMSFYQWAGNSISADLAKLIEAKGAPTDLNAAKCEEAGVIIEDIVGEIVRCETISVKNKKAILARCGFKFSSFDIYSVDEETMKAMIETETIEMNNGMLDEFRACRPNMTLDYIFSDLGGFLKLIGADSSDEPEREIEEDEILGLLRSNINVSEKLVALSCFCGTIRLDVSYGAEIISAILIEHFDPDDIEILPSYYEEASARDKDLIAKIFAEYDEKCIDEEIDFSWDLLFDSLQYLKTSRMRTLHILAWYFRKNGDENDRDKVKRCYEIAELEDYTKLIGGFTAMIPESNFDDEMLAILAELGMCGTISPNVNVEGLRRVYPKGYKRMK